MCPAAKVQGNLHNWKECFTVWVLSLADGNGHPPMAAIMVQLMLTKVNNTNLAASMSCYCDL